MWLVSLFLTMSNVQIFYIYAENCEECEKALNIVNQSISESKISCDIKMFNCQDRVAINIAIKHNIEDIPACVIGKSVFQLGKFNKEDILKAIKKASKV